MRHLGKIFAATVIVGSSGSALAQQLIATRPGLMCASTDALGRLTLPNGDSRTHALGPRPDDLAAASAGGCIDIPPGARVQVQQAFRNTSRVVYAGPGAPADGLMTIPNIDFRPDTDTASPAAAILVPPGLAIAQHVAAGGGKTLVLLQDARLTPAIRRAMESSGGEPVMAFPDRGALYNEFTARPIRNGQLLLLSGEGQVIGRRPFAYPFATIKPAPLHGMSAPTFLFEIDESAGTGSTGPVTELLAPVQQGLDPVQAAGDRGGRPGPIRLSATIVAMWRIVPARSGGTEEIEEATCGRDANGSGTLYLRTYRFHDGRWTFAARSGGECGELEVFPDRRLFP